MERIILTGRKIEEVEKEIAKHLKSKNLNDFEYFRFIKAFEGKEIIEYREGQQIIVNLQAGSNEGYYIFISIMSCNILNDYFILRFHLNLDDVLLYQNELIRCLGLKLN